MAERHDSEDRPDETDSDDRPDDAGTDEQSDETRDESRSDEHEDEDRPDETGDDDEDRPDEDPDEERSDSERITGTSPSGADISKLEKFEPSEEAKQAEPSKEDAMGRDKRRQIVGQSYGPSKSRQFMFFGIVAVVLIVVVGGWLALVAAFDKPPSQISNSAPWSKTQTDPALAAQQNATPIAPSSPCGEPGNEFPTPPESPCAPPSKANGNQGSNAGDPTNVTGVSKAQ
jgi:hypothetical protein